MSEYIALNVAAHNQRGLAESALPGAPVLIDVPSRRATRPARTWTADRIRALAVRGQRLADQLDPGCGAQNRALRT